MIVRMCSLVRIEISFLLSASNKLCSHIHPSTLSITMWSSLTWASSVLLAEMSVAMLFRKPSRQVASGMSHFRWLYATFQRSGARINPYATRHILLRSLTMLSDDRGFSVSYYFSKPPVCQVKQGHRVTPGWRNDAWSLSEVQAPSWMVRPVADRQGILI